MRSPNEKEAASAHSANSPLPTEKQNANNSIEKNYEIKGAGPAIEFTIASSDHGDITKTIELDENGKVISHGGGKIWSGKMRRVCLPDWKRAADDIINEMPGHCCLITGALVPECPDIISLVTRDMFEKKSRKEGCATRTLDFLKFRKVPTLGLIDHDQKHFPEAVRKRIKALGGFMSALTIVCPALAGIGHILRKSTSSCLSNSETGEQYPDSGGYHHYIPFEDGTDYPRALRVLHDRCWLLGWAGYWISKAVAALEYSLVDVAVGSPEREVFEAAPNVKAPLVQDREARKAKVFDGRMAKASDFPDLTADERCKVEELKARAREKLKPDAAKAKVIYIEEKVTELGGDPIVARAAVERMLSDGVLIPGMTVEFVDKNLGVVDVDEIIGDPERYDKKSCYDPIEGRSYGHPTGIFYANTKIIFSWAHGGKNYWLRRNESGVTLDDFYAYMPTHNYIFAPSREMWPAPSVDARLGSIPLRDTFDTKGKPIKMRASLWLDKNRPVEQTTWAPGLPMLIVDRLIANGGWIDRKDVTCFNQYRPPTIVLGDADKAGPWLDHVRKVYPNDADHIIRWLAQRVRRPQQKINHALLLGGNQGIGKDTILEPVKQASALGISRRSDQ
jgi:hypothetical protein